MLRVGCCGFAKAQGKYFATFDALEVQKTFYQPPKEENRERIADFFKGVDTVGCTLLFEPRGKWTHADISEV